MESGASPAAAESEVAAVKLKGQDLAVMNTSNDALITKVYSSSLGYFEDQYSQLFIKGGKKKMLPIINRGTWARVVSVRQVITRFLNAFASSEKPAQILSLGAGFDISYFWIQDLVNAGKLPETVKKAKFIEVDYHDVVEKKIQIIQKNESLWKHILSSLDEVKTEQVQHFSINTENYKLFATDIRETAKLSEKLLTFGVDPLAPTLLLTECVLIYLKPDESTKVLNFAKEFFKGDTAFLNYEMINPSDPFGRMMLENLEDRGCRLQGIHECPTEAAQIARMKAAAGMSAAECYSMSVVYSRKMEQAERLRIEKIEIFDEFEEWDLLQSHYCLCLGKRIEKEEVSKAVHI